MSAAEVLKTARAVGVELKLDGDDLVLEAAAPPPETILVLLSRHKPDIVALLQCQQQAWLPHDWQHFFEERARISEFDGGSSHAEAKTHAFACCVVEWLTRHPSPSAPGSCGWCDRTELWGAVILPFGTEPGSHAWLHAECWPAWYASRKAQAIAALAEMGLTGPRTSYEI